MFNVDDVWLTGDGRKARIMATDLGSTFTMGAEVDNFTNGTSYRLYTGLGESRPGEQSELDLIAPYYLE